MESASAEEECSVMSEVDSGAALEDAAVGQGLGQGQDGQEKIQDKKHIDDHDVNLEEEQPGVAVGAESGTTKGEDEVPTSISTDEAHLREGLAKAEARPAPKFMKPAPRDHSASLSSQSDHDSASDDLSSSRRSRVSLNPDDMEALAVGILLPESGPGAPVDGRPSTTLSRSMPKSPTSHQTVRPLDQFLKDDTANPTPRVRNSLLTTSVPEGITVIPATGARDPEVVAQALSEAERHSGISLYSQGETTNDNDDDDHDEANFADDLSESSASMPSDSSIVFEKDLAYLPHTRRAHSHDGAGADLGGTSWSEHHVSNHQKSNTAIGGGNASTGTLPVLRPASLSQFLSRSMDFRGSVDQSVNLMDVSASKRVASEIYSQPQRKQRNILWSTFDDIPLASGDAGGRRRSFIHQNRNPQRSERNSGVKLNADYSDNDQKRKQKGISMVPCLFVMVCAVLLGIGLVVIMLVLVGRDTIKVWMNQSVNVANGFHFPSPKSMVFERNKMASDQVASLVIERGVSSEESIHRAHSTQQRAVEWVARTRNTAQLWYTDPDTILELYAMAVLYYEWLDHSTTNDPVLPGWNVVAYAVKGDVAPCQWPGVTCLEDESVVGVNWTNSHLQGTMPEEIHILTDLRVLDLSHNALGGTLPLVLGQLTQLQTFQVQDTGFAGAVPEEVCFLKTEHRLLNLVADCTSDLECDCCDECY